MNRLVLIQKKQRGVVLIVALIFLVALTAVAAALMQNSSTDMKMSGASEIKEEATQAVISAVDEVIFNQVAPGEDNLFARPLAGNFPINDPALLLPGTNTAATAIVSVAASNELLLEPDCPHSKSASSTGVFTCNVLIIGVNRPYGRNNTSNLNVNSGIAQQLLK
jgi:hypothetical protein